MIIDAHVHLFKSDKIDRFYTPETYFAEAEKWGIEKAICMPNIGSGYNHNGKMWNLIPKYEGKIFPLLNINDDCKIIPNIRNSEIYGYKYHPSIYQIPIDQLEIYSLKPVLVHCGRDPISHIKYLICAAKKYPQTPFIAAHLGGNASELANAAIDDVLYNKVENIWMDTSGIKLPWLIKKAVNKLGSDKILFGTDVPYGDIGLSIRCVELAELSKEEQKQVFSLNVLKLL